MTKKLNDLFDVEAKTTKELETKKDVIVVDNEPPNPVQDHDANQAIIDLSDVKQHELDMDAIAIASMDAYEKFLEIADNVDERNVGRILEAAVQMQRNAIDAKNSKLRSRQKAAEILLKKKQIDDKAELEDADIIDDEADQEESSITGDRNKILDMLKEQD